MNQGSISTAQVAPILLMLIRDRWPDGGGLEILAENAGCDMSAIESILEQQHEGVSFNLVDKLFCVLGRIDIWRGALADVYLNADLSLRKCGLESCNKFVYERGAAGNTRRYCSIQCNKLASKVRHGEGTGKRYVQKNRCLKGHKLEGANVVWAHRADGDFFRQCKKCKMITQREAQRAYRARHADRVKANQAAYRARKRALVSA